MKRHTTGPVRNGSRGASLIEIVVAVVIGLLVMGGVYKIFHSNSLTYRTQEAAARIQENGRLGVELLSRDIRMAGYRGCSTFGPITNTLNNATLIEFDFNRPIEGFDNIDAANVPNRLSNAGISPLNETDVIVVRASRDEPVPIVRNNSSAQLFAAVTEDQANGCPDGTDRISGICEGDILMVSDCTKSRIFQTGNIQVTTSGGVELNVTHPASGDPGNISPASWGGASAPAEERFGPDSEIIKISTLIYFVAENADTGVPSLFVKENNFTPVELVDGVENMQILYGIDTGGASAIDTYVAAFPTHDDADWANVRSVRLALLMRSVDEIGAGDLDTNTHTLLFDEDGDPLVQVGPENDRHLRRVVNTTIAIRNRLR
jgi:type IV pilus assembly protein PilW